MKLVRWKRLHLADLTKLPPLEHNCFPPTLSPARPRAQEAKAVGHVVLTAFSLDSTWSDTLNLFRERLEMQLDLAFQRETFPALVVTHGPRIIATSVLNSDPEADSNLVSGPCVLDRVLQPRARVPRCSTPRSSNSRRRACRGWPELPRKTPRRANFSTPNSDQTGRVARIRTGTGRHLARCSPREFLCGQLFSNYEVGDFYDEMFAAPAAGPPALRKGPRAL